MRKASSLSISSSRASFGSANAGRAVKRAPTPIAAAGIAVRMARRDAVVVFAETAMAKLPRFALVRAGGKRELPSGLLFVYTA
jgi:hypothetical protein